jgi:hypothetical protein
VTKLATAGSAPLLYSTYLGGSGTDDGRGIALDAVGDAHVTGATDSTDFPVTVGAFDMTANGGFDAYATKLDPAGSAPLVYSGYLGGSGLDLGEAIAIDPSGSAYVTGTTASTNFPTTPDALDSALDGQDAFVTKLAATGTAPLEHSTYLGGSGNDDGRGIAADPAANAYVTGVTDSTGFPTTPGAFDATFNGSADAFVTKLSTDPATPPGPGPPATLTLTPTVATNTVGATHCVTARVTDAAGTPLAGVTVRFAVPTASTTHASPSSGSAATDAAGQASFCFTASLPGEDAIHAFADANGNGGQDVGEPFGDATKTWTLPPTTKHCEVTIVDAGLIVTDLGDPATFGGLVSTDDDAEPWGHEEYADAGPHHTEHMRSKAILAVTCSADGTAATIVGSATVGGDGSALFRIDVTVAHSGAPATYGIVLSDGYASGTHRLQAGTIKIFRDDD